MKPFMKEPTRKARLVVLLLVVIASPLLLFLRGWYGFRVLLVLIGASLAAPYVMSFIDVFFVSGYKPSPPFTKIITERYYIREVLIAGCIWQAALTLIGAAWITAFRQQAPHRGFLGSFVLTPSTSPTLPYDFIVLAAASAALYFGFTIPALPFELPESIATLPYVQLLTGGVKVPPQSMIEFPIPMIVCYVLLVVDSQLSHGLLRYFDHGERPAAPQRRLNPATALVARLLQMPTASREDLAAIFSRRHPALSQITGPRDKP